MVSPSESGDRMKRILIVIATLSIGGAEKVACDIGLGALARGNIVHFLVFGDNVGAYENVIRSYGGEIIHIPSPSANYRKYFCTLKRLIREHQYDVVHAHTMFNVGWAMLAATQCGVPVRIAHAHSALMPGKQSTKVMVYEAAMRKLILDNATDLVACGVDAGNRLFGEKAFRERGTLILNGIDTAAFAFDEAARNQIRSELGWEDAFLIGHVGHLATVKNQSYLLERMTEILRRKPNARLVLLGEGDARPMLERRIRDLGLPDVVKMTGNVRNVPDYLSAMDVFAFPSLYEGMPLSILEVQANGLPCILSTGVPKDVYQSDLIRPLSLDEPEKWVEAICTAKRKNSEAYAMRLHDAGFDTQTAMRKIYDIYERVDRS